MLKQLMDNDSTAGDVWQYGVLLMQALTFYQHAAKCVRPTVLGRPCALTITSDPLWLKLLAGALLAMETANSAAASYAGEPYETPNWT